MLPGLLVFLGLVFLVPLPIYGASIAKDLESLKKRIEKEKRGISQVQKKEGSVLQALGKIEGELERKSKELKATHSRLDAILGELQRKEAEAERLQSSINQRRELLRKRAVALYRWYRGGSPFVILNGDVPLGAFLQRKRYLETTVSFDRELVQRLSNEAEHQESLKQELARERDEVDDQRKALAEIQNSVRKEAEKKKELLASLRKEKESRARALKELEQAGVRLQKMMEELSKKSGSQMQEVPSGARLDAMKGKLEWPVKGEVKSGFGKTRHPEFSAEVFRKGVDIEAPLGDEIRAVEKGRVVFADRFSGYGKMLIIDHGERYYTIYAHLSDILKKNGDAVKRGETVGLVGDSDSLSGAKLYFEMRKDGKSIDPLPWFRR